MLIKNNINTPSKGRKIIKKDKKKITKFKDWYIQTTVSIMKYGKYKSQFTYEVSVFILNIIKELQNGLF